MCVYQFHHFVIYWLHTNSIDVCHYPFGILAALF